MKRLVIALIATLALLGGFASSDSVAASPTTATGYSRCPGADHVSWSTLAGKKYSINSGFCIAGDAAELDLQSDGNLVDYDYTAPYGSLERVAIWSSHTTAGGNGKAAFLVLSTQGNMSLYSSSNKLLWTTYHILSPQTGHARIQHPGAGHIFALKMSFMYETDVATCPGTYDWVTEMAWINKPSAGVADYQYIWAREEDSPGSDVTDRCDYTVPSDGKNPGIKQ